jgi:hypothetical protein
MTPIRSVHQRHLAVPPDRIGALLDTLGSADDALWPVRDWGPMELDGPLAVGARGGHHGVRYHVEEHAPGRRVVFRFEPPTGITGTHTFEVTEEERGCRLRHEIEGSVGGVMRLLWPLVVEPLHDDLLTDLLDRAQATVGPPPHPRRRPFRVRVLRAAGRPRPVAPRAALAAAALLAGAAAIHVVWATGNPWPAADADAFARTVLGARPEAGMPSAFASLVVAGLLGTAATVVLSTGGWLDGRLPRRPSQAIAWTVAAVLALRGAAGLVGSGLLELTPVPFRWWDLGLYAPLCLGIAALAGRAAAGSPLHRT